MPDLPGEIAALGPFFAVCSHPPGMCPSGPWRPLTELTVPSQRLAGRIRAVHTVMAGEHEGQEERKERTEREEREERARNAAALRAVASVTHLGLVARLAAPAVAAMALGHCLDLRPDGLWWQEVPGGPVPLSVPEPRTVAWPRGVPEPRTTPEPLGIPEPWGVPEPRAVADDLIDGLIAPVTAAVRGLVPVSPRVLWGNVASAVSGAAVQVAVQRPDLSGQALAAAAAIFARPALGREHEPPGPAFRRSSCCLRYRLFPRLAGNLCGDCILLRSARPW